MSISSTVGVCALGRGDERVEDGILVRPAGNRTERPIRTRRRRHDGPAVGQRQVDAPAPRLGRAAATGMAQAEQDLALGSGHGLPETSAPPR